MSTNSRHLIPALVLAIAACSRQATAPINASAGKTRAPIQILVLDRRNFPAHLRLEIATQGKVTSGSFTLRTKNGQQLSAIDNLPAEAASGNYVLTFDLQRKTLTENPILDSHMDIDGIHYDSSHEIDILPQENKYHKQNLPEGYRKLKELK